jgi:peptidoglycan/xylan/chitin deacetylase (PgdA/CDA1 family)
MNHFLKNLIFSFLNLFNKNLKNKASILMYHSVGLNRAFFTVSPKEFEKQLVYLKENNFKVIRLSELLEKLKNEKDISNCVVLTFDDGYQDNFYNAFKLLKKYNFPASIFIATAYVDKQMINSEGVSIKILSLENISEMNKTGLIEFLPHTKNHLDLTKVNLEKAEQEIKESFSFLSQNLSSVPKIFAYPKGKYYKEIIDLLVNLGYTGAVTVKEGLVSRESSFFELPRNSIDKKTSFYQFKGKLSKSIEIFNFYKKWIL